MLASLTGVPPQAYSLTLKQAARDQYKEVVEGREQRHVVGEVERRRPGCGPQV